MVLKILEVAAAVYRGEGGKQARRKKEDKFFNRRGECAQVAERLAELKVRGGAFTRSMQ